MKRLLGWLAFAAILSVGIAPQTYGAEQMAVSGSQIVQGTC